MVRTCHQDTCPVGIATQRLELRAKFAGDARDGRGVPPSRCTGGAAAPGPARASLGRGGGRPRRPPPPARGGRGGLAGRPPRCLRAPRAARGGSRSGSWVTNSFRWPGTSSVSSWRPTRSRFSRRRACSSSTTRSRTADRAVGARLGGLIGARFGAAEATRAGAGALRGGSRAELRRLSRRRRQLTLTGEANDYVGKGMGGDGSSSFRPPDDAGDPVLLGNTVLYGATGGELYCAGQAGERFAVRLSGATAVVEGTGGNPCEYMTAGTVVVLGDVGRNLGAGMTGGEVYVFDPAGACPSA